MYNSQIALFFKLILFLYFTPSGDELYIFHFILPLLYSLFPKFVS